MRKHILSFVALSGLSLVSLPTAAGAAVLDFAGDICGPAGDAACGNGSQLGQDYGDVTGQLDISYRSFLASNGDTVEAFLKYWAGNYGDLSNVIWGGTGATLHKAEIVFTPLAGYEVAILSLDAGCYLNRASCQTLNYELTSLSGDAIASGATSTLFPTHASLAFNSGYFTDGIKLVWGPDSYDVGLDNIVFDVRAIVTAPPGAVPEPATWAMMIGGFAMVGASLRGRRKVSFNFA